MDNPILCSGPDKQVPPKGRVETIWTGTLVVSGEVGWIIQRRAADVTIASLQFYSVHAHK